MNNLVGYKLYVYNCDVYNNIIVPNLSILCQVIEIQHPSCQVDRSQKF